jgi:excisionase family DNA binding protein
MNDRKAILRPADLAPLLGVSTARVYQLISSGDIPAIRIGGAWRVPKAAWESWLREQGTKAINAAERARHGAREHASGVNGVKDEG